MLMIQGCNDWFAIQFDGRKTCYPTCDPYLIYLRIRQFIACNTWIAFSRRVAQPEMVEARKLIFPVMTDAVELLYYPHNR